MIGGYDWRLVIRGVLVRLMIVMMLCALLLPACAHGGWTSGHHGVPVQPTPAPAAPINLLPNDRVIFAGDSITYFGGMTNGFVQQFGALVQAKYPGQNITIGAAGYPGKGVQYLAAALPAIIAQYQPTVLVIEIGVNDAPAQALGYETIAQFQTWYTSIITQAQAARIRELVLLTPMCEGEKRDGENMYDTQVDQISWKIRGLGYWYSQPVIDLRTAWLQKELLYNPNDLAGGVLDDSTYGLHPNALGAQVLSQLLFAGFTGGGP